MLERQPCHQHRPLRVVLLERRPAPPWLQDLVDGDVDVGGDGDGTSSGKTITVESWQCQRRQCIEGWRPGLHQRRVVHDALGGGSPPFPVPSVFASAFNCHLRQSLGVNSIALVLLGLGRPAAATHNTAVLCHRRGTELPPLHSKRGPDHGNVDQITHLQPFQDAPPIGPCCQTDDWI